MSREDLAQELLNAPENQIRSRVEALLSENSGRDRLNAFVEYCYYHDREGLKTLLWGYVESRVRLRFKRVVPEVFEDLRAEAYSYVLSKLFDPGVVFDPAKGRILTWVSQFIENALRSANYHVVLKYQTEDRGESIDRDFGSGEDDPEPALVIREKGVPLFVDDSEFGKNLRGFVAINQVNEVVRVMREEISSGGFPRVCGGYTPLQLSYIWKTVRPENIVTVGGR